MSRTLPAPAETDPHPASQVRRGASPSSLRIVKDRGQAKGSRSSQGANPSRAWLRPARLALFYASLFAAWWIVAARQIWPPYLLPSPVDVGIFLRESLADGTLIPAVLTSAARVSVGYGVALVGGTVLGLALARSRLLDETLGSAVVGLQSLPSICWFPLALIWFNLSEKAVLFVIVMGSLFAITLAVRAGVRQIPPLTLRAARMLGAGSGLRLWQHVLLPAILPAFLSGMRQGWAFAWRSLMAAELLSQSLKIGIGHLLSNGRDLNDMSMVLGMIFVILALGLLVDRLLFFPVERAVARRWGVEGA
ncbi:MAG: ABC transporter permease [Cytophagales bacterium]|nr:ABC transporter permease [Armatimonadota bacterium]